MRKRTRISLLAALALFVASFALAPAALAQNGAPPPKKNVFQRHPTMTGIGAGVATHHALKVSAKRKKMQGKKLNWAERHPTLSAIGAGAATRHVAKKTGQNKR